MNFTRLRLLDYADDTLKFNIFKWAVSNTERP